MPWRWLWAAGGSCSEWEGDEEQQLTALAVWEQAQAPAPLLIFPWCIALLTGLLRALLFPGALIRPQHQPTDWGGTFFFLFLLFCYYEETFCILRKMCFPLRKEHGYRSTAPIWPLWFRKAKRKILAPEALIHLPDTFQGTPQAAPATVSLYPAFSGQGNMLWPVQNLSAVNITYSI